MLFYLEIVGPSWSSMHNQFCFVLLANVCDVSRGLEDVKMSCVSIHSDHSSGLPKTLQDYRYNGIISYTLFIY